MFSSACRRDDRLKGEASCYECGEEISDVAIAEFKAATEFAATHSPPPAG